MRISRVVRSCAWVLPLLLPLPLQAQQSYPLAGQAAIYDLVGNVRLEAGQGADVVVRVEKLGHDAGSLRVQTGTVGAWKTLAVVFPDRDIAYRGEHQWDHGRSSVTVRENGTFLDGDFWRDEANAGGAADELLHSPEHKVYLLSDGDGLDARADLVVAVPRGRRVAIFVAAGRVEAQNVEGTLRVGTLLGDIALQGGHGGATARTISANVRLTNHTGPVDASSISGSVTLDGAREGTVHLRSISGSVDAADVTGEVVEVSSTSGSVSVRRLSVGSARLSSTSGSVHAELTRVPKELRARSVSGDVGVALPEQLGAHVRMSTVSGSLDSAFPVTVRSVGRRVMEGTIGDGAAELDLSTVSGSVHLQRLAGGA